MQKNNRHRLSSVLTDDLEASASKTGERTNLMDENREGGMQSSLADKPQSSKCTESDFMIRNEVQRAEVEGIYGREKVKQ
jgi:hypothetical protein